MWFYLEYNILYIYIYGRGENRFQRVKTERRQAGRMIIKLPRGITLLRNKPIDLANMGGGGALWVDVWQRRKIEGFMRMPLAGTTVACMRCRTLIMGITIIALGCLFDGGLSNDDLLHFVVAAANL